MDAYFASDFPNSSLFRPKARSLLANSLKDNLSSLLARASYAQPHQQALHLNLYTRQRRRVASQLNLVSRYLVPVAPFYDEALIAFFMNQKLVWGF